MNEDILIVRTNGNPNYVGRSAIFQNMIESFTFASYLIRLRVNKNKILPNYMSYYLQSNVAKKQFKMLAHTSAGNFNINREDIGAIKIIVPKINEQKQIISFLDNLQQIIFKQKEHIKKLYVLRQSSLNSKLTKEKTNVTN